MSKSKGSRLARVGPHPRSLRCRRRAGNIGRSATGKHRIRFTSDALRSRRGSAAHLAEGEHYYRTGALLDLLI